MKQKEKIEVALAALEAQLVSTGLWREYFLGFRQTHLNGSAEENYTRWKTWAINLKPHMWVASALDWSETKSGIDTWSRFDYMWLTWIRNNLNN